MFIPSKLAHLARQLSTKGIGSNETTKGNVVMSLAAALGEACNDQSVSVITSDGKVIVGTLKGIDSGTNVILDDSHERVFSIDQGVEKHQLGLCVIRGENVAMIGQVDRDTDRSLDLTKCKAKPLKPVVH